MTNPLICRAVVSKGIVSYEGPSSLGSDVQTQILEDKKYGIMVPKNGKYFTVRISDWSGKYISNKKVIKGIMLSWFAVEMETLVSVKLAKPGEYADFKVFFRRLVDDPILNKSTLAYHYFPISNFDDPNRGICVFNIDYPFTVDGEGIPLNVFDPEHYPTETASRAMTYDIDKIYRHEGPGHGLGLPHTTNPGEQMSTNYDIISEHPDRNTILRWIAKYGKRGWTDRKYMRMKQWYAIKSDKY